MTKPLKITFVVDTYGLSTNGTTMTAMRSVEALRKRGHHVKVITGSSGTDKDLYSTGYRKWPPLYQISRSQGMFLAKANKKVLKQVISDSDIVHFLLPFKLQKKGKIIADALDVPSSAAFHLQPENITFTIHLNKFNFINNALYAIFRRFYNKFTHVHCPSEMIANQLKKRNYESKLHIISNGVAMKFKPETVNKPQNLKDKYVVLMIGRLSREKRQDLVVEAVRQSNYEKYIQIVFAGQGPNKRTIKSLGRKLSNPPIINFFSQDELQKVINYSDVYVHASDIEIEAISCIEAFSCGLVPIISDSEISATNQFALTDDNLFEKGNALSLARKIDCLLSNPEKREKLSKEYVRYAENFTLDKSLDQLEKMFLETIKYHSKFSSKA